jgi:hypothetical protein
LWVFVWGIEDLDLYSVCVVVVVVVLFFPLLLVRETACKREKKAFFNSVRVNSSSLKRASYCSFASEICPIEEFAAVGCLLFFLILLVFCPKEEPIANALSPKSSK